MKHILTVLLMLAVSTIAMGEDSKVVAKRLTEEAVAFAKANGKEKVIAAINVDKKFKEGDVYVTIFDMKGTCLAHPIKPGRVNANQIGDKDPNGVAFIADRIKIAEQLVKDSNLAEDKRWHTYIYQNPISRRNEKKINYVAVYDGMVISAGAYIP